MKHFLALFLVLNLSVCFAQIDTPTKITILKPFIEVTGTASKEIIPDRIFISIILSDKVVNNENYTIQTQEDKLKKALININIDLNNLVLSDAISEITWGKRKESGFVVKKKYVLQVKNSEEVSKVFGELYAINIKESSILRTEHSKIDSLKKEVRIIAIKAAKDKAEYLLTAIGEQLDKPLEIREQNIYSQRDDEVANKSNVFSNQVSVEASPTETSFKPFTISFSYFIKYSIK